MSMEQNENCNLEEKAVLYAYGELSEKETESFESHLPKCRACTGTVKAIRTAGDIISARKHDPSEITVRFIMARSDEFCLRHDKSFFRKKALAFSFAAFVALSVFAIISGTGNLNQGLETASALSEEIIMSDIIPDEEIGLIEDEITAEIDLWE